MIKSVKLLLVSIHFYHVLVVNHLTGVQTGIFMVGNDQVRLFFKRSQHLYLAMVA